jgi:hypothetical protein
LITIRSQLEADVFTGHAGPHREFRRSIVAMTGNTSGKARCIKPDDLLVLTVG